MSDLSRDEFYQAISRMETAMRDGFSGVHDRLDDLNGRTRTAETKIAVLEDRGLRDNTARATGIGAMMTAVGTFVYQHFTK